MTKEDISAEFPNLESEDVDFLISRKVLKMRAAEPSYWSMSKEM